MILFCLLDAGTIPNATKITRFFSQNYYFPLLVSGEKCRASPWRGRYPEHLPTLMITTWRGPTINLPQLSPLLSDTEAVFVGFIVVRFVVATNYRRMLVSDIRAFLMSGSSSSTSVEVERMVPSRSTRIMAPPLLGTPFLLHTWFSSFSSSRLCQG